VEVETMTMSGAQPDPSVATGRVTTQRVAEARDTITQVPVVPRRETGLTRFADRLRGVQRGDRAPAQPPIPGTHYLRLLMTMLLGTLCVLTVGGAVLLLLLWQQGRESGVLTSQIDRTWDLLDTLQTVERYVAFAVVPVAMAWIALAAVNVGRSTGNRRNPIVAALSLPVGLIGAWLIGREVIGDSDDAITRASGWVLQAVLLAVPLLFLVRLAVAAEARHRPIRATYVIGIGYLAQMQFLGGLSTIDRVDADGEWGKLGAYLMIGGLIQVIGTLSANEACRAVEDGTQHRYDLRSRFSESLLAQAAMH
jgi:hypothetical protein